MLPYEDLVRTRMYEAEQLASRQRLARLLRSHRRWQRAAKRATRRLERTERSLTATENWIAQSAG
ncbi:hypothetical protein JOF56_009946 [Kibdelosporangium banguiense]|uniref:Uncharacterized protein n=1 Tax=Kibdelosporangium banguiense TaxID=1365924 RepID=A0ABS4U071_9PSEU|nr:hypothetical protein [Kibdelosporangium banguiense]MBP2329561.1 hypothetical protein [Kibdelosporangium banguiense]